MKTLEVFAPEDLPEPESDRWSITEVAPAERDAPDDLAIRSLLEHPEALAETAAWWEGRSRRSRRAGR